MKVELKEESSTDYPERVICTAARNDYRQESVVGLDPTDDDDYAEIMDSVDGATLEAKTRNLIRKLLRKGHFGVFEQARAFYAVEGVSRVTMAQITRHRHMSFDVQSQRYVDFSEKEPVVPPTMTETHPSYANSKHTWGEELEEHWRRSVEKYTKAVEDGVPKEDARFFLPQATPVNMAYSGNVRTLLHVLDLRHSGAAQWEVRELADEMIAEMREWCPIVVEEWEDKVKNASLQSP